MTKIIGNNRAKLETMKLYFTFIFTFLLLFTAIISLFAMLFGIGYSQDGTMKYATDEVKYVIRLLFPFAVSVSMLMIGYFFGKSKGKLEILEQQQECLDNNIDNNHNKCASR